MNKFNIDERTSQTAGRISTFTLTFTQMGLLGIILYRAYVLKQPDENLRDMQAVLFLSIFGQLFASLYFGGHFPVFDIKTLGKIYLAFVIGLTVILSLWLGVPQLSEWSTTILPVVVGPAILLGLYHLFAQWGQKRMSQDLEE